MLRGDALTEVMRQASRRLSLEGLLNYMESTTLFSSESALLLVMFLMVAVGFWLQRFKVFKVLGPALTVIVTGIILSNLKIVPVSSPTYDASAVIVYRCLFLSVC